MIDDCGVRPEGCVLRTLFGYITLSEMPCQKLRGGKYE